MSDNKPLLFIDTVQADLNPNIGQEIYDSRYHKKLEPIPESEEQVPDMVPDDLVKLQKKLSLLDKRAKVDHFVYVELVLNSSESLSGFFKGYQEDSVILAVEDQQVTIPFINILDVHILKV